MIDETYLTQTLRDLVAINSANPDLSQDGAGELAIARYTAAAMQALGMQAQVDEPAPGRANAVGLLRGAGGGKRLMWNAHMDTVGINGMPQPFEACVRDGRLYGRGAQDMKGSLAAMLAAVKALRDQGVTLKGDLLLTGVADEEYASLGTQDIVRRYQADAAIVTEPTEMIISRAHRGFIGFELEFFGRAAHGSRYQEGIDAILMLGRFLNELAGLEAELRARTPHPLVGPPSLHTSLVRGGTEMSTYPAHCYLMIERRTVPGETVESAQAELHAILDRLAAQDAAFKATLK
ncbi:MAG: M20/M25/M40 family metallo-hydrolase, partial [Chloroflexota bacterium]